MTPQEFDYIRAALKSAYPTFNIMPDKYSIQLWFKLLGDLPYKICETALFELFATHEFPPQIAEIRSKCAEYMKPQIKDAGEAWGEIQRVVRNYGFGRADEALEALTPTVREAAKRLGFREFFMNENQEAVRAHFFKIYNAIAERAANDAKLPAAVLEQKQQYMLESRQEHKREALEEMRKEEAEAHKIADPDFIDKLLREHGFRR